MPNSMPMRSKMLYGKKPKLGMEGMMKASKKPIKKTKKK